MGTVTTDVIRLDSSLKKQAESVGEVFNRKASQQIEYWAKIGQALERMDSVSIDKIRECLSGKTSLDELKAEEKAIALVRLHEMETNAVFTDFSVFKHKAGLPHTTLDKKGCVVRVFPDGRKEIIQ